MYSFELRKKKGVVADFNQLNPVEGSHFVDTTINGTDLVGCVSSLEIPQASGGRPPGFNSPWRG